MLSRLAREELRHFEQVIAIMERRKMAYPALTASGYVGMTTTRGHPEEAV